MPSVVPELPELFEEAYEMAGLEMRSGYDLRTIRRSLNLLLLEWQNRGLNLFSIAAGTQALTPGTATYTMPADTIDLIEHQLRTGTGTNQMDTNLERVSVATYAQQSNKALQGRPTQIFIQRLATGVTATLWPVPDTQQSYTLAFYRLKGMDGLSSGVGGAVDIPPRFIPALVAGLAYAVASKRPEVAARVMPLKQAYEEQFARAAEEDRDRASVFLLPPAGGGW
jgi:hypothetical protein